MVYMYKVNGFVFEKFKDGDVIAYNLNLGSEAYIFNDTTMKILDLITHYELDQARSVFMSSYKNLSNSKSDISFDFDNIVNILITNKIIIWRKDE